jgi:hypothetical protein
MGEARPDDAQEPHADRHADALAPTRQRLAILPGPGGVLRKVDDVPARGTDGQTWSDGEMEARETRRATAKDGTEGSRSAASTQEYVEERHPRTDRREHLAGVATDLEGDRGVVKQPKLLDDGKD